MQANPKSVEASKRWIIAVFAVVVLLSVAFGVVTALTA